MTRTLRRILHVEDEADIRAIAHVALEQIGGFEVLAVASGGEAVERAAAFMPDIVLLDVMMPGMDGPATLAALRRLPALVAVPVVFVTAKAQQAEIAKLRDLGAADVVTKPFDPVRLPEQVRAAWSAWRKADAGTTEPRR